MAWLFSFVGYRNRVVVVGLDVAVDIAVASGDPRLVGESKDVLLRTNDRVEMGHGILLEGDSLKIVLLFFLPDMAACEWFALFVHVESGRIRHTFGRGFL
jgi:hypothetical protein